MVLILGRKEIRVLHVPCGSMTWMPSFLLDDVADDDVKIEYTGMDSVPHVINEHREYFKFIPSMKFEIHDIVQEPLSESYDLIIWRHMTKFRKKSEIMSALRHIDGSGSGFMYATTGLVGRDTPQYNLTSKLIYKHQNLLDEPFWLENPICIHEEIKGIDGMGLWQLPFE